jgi:hypothetical protein
LAYRFGGKQKELSLGQYPEITLAKAREKRDDARRLIANGADPGAAKQEAKRAAAALRPFVEWADEWMEKQENLQPPLSDKTLVGKQRFVSYLKEQFGTKALADIKRSDVVVHLREYESEGTLESRDRVRSVGEKIFEYAIWTAPVSTHSAISAPSLPITRRHHGRLSPRRKTRAGYSRR